MLIWRQDNFTYLGHNTTNRNILVKYCGQVCMEVGYFHDHLQQYFNYIQQSDLSLEKAEEYNPL